MQILNKLGISKEAIARLLGTKPVETEVKRKGRPRGRFIPDHIVDAVRAEHRSCTDKEIALKYGVSNYWVWCVRNRKLRTKSK